MGTNRKETVCYSIWVQQFHQYIYGQTVQVQTVHKPLVSLFNKPLSDVPSRLQRIMLNIQKYDVRVSYTPGKYL